MDSLNKETIWKKKLKQRMDFIFIQYYFYDINIFCVLIKRWRALSAHKLSIFVFYGLNLATCKHGTFFFCLQYVFCMYIVHSCILFIHKNIICIYFSWKVANILLHANFVLQSAYHFFLNGDYYWMFLLVGFQTFAVNKCKSECFI